MLWLAKVIEDIFKWCDTHSARLASYLRKHFGDPSLWTKQSRSVHIRNFSFENENRLIGDIVTVIVIVFVIMMITAAVVIRQH